MLGRGFGVIGLFGNLKHLVQNVLEDDESTYTDLLLCERWEAFTCMSPIALHVLIPSLPDRCARHPVSTGKNKTGVKAIYQVDGMDEQLHSSQSLPYGLMLHLQQGVQACVVALLLPEAVIVCLEDPLVAGKQPVLQNKKRNDATLLRGIGRWPSLGNKASHTHPEELLQCDLHPDSTSVQ